MEMEEKRDSQRRSFIGGAGHVITDEQAAKIEVDAAKFKMAIAPKDAFSTVTTISISQDNQHRLANPQSK